VKSTSGQHPAFHLERRSCGICQQQHAGSLNGSSQDQRPNQHSQSSDLIITNIECTMYAGCCRPTMVDAACCKAALESGLLRFPPVTGPDRSHSLLLQTGVSPSPSASRTPTRQTTPAPHPLLLVPPLSMRILPSPFHAAPPRDHRTAPLGPGRPAPAAPRFAQWRASEEEATEVSGQRRRKQERNLQILYVLQGPTQWLAESLRFKRLRWLGSPYFPAHPRGNRGVLLLSIPISSDISAALLSR
jgi:hypothetical protein